MRRWKDRRADEDQSWRIERDHRRGVSCFQGRSGSMLPPIRYKYRYVSTVEPGVGVPRCGTFPGRSPGKPPCSREGVPGANVSLPHWLSAPPGRDPSREPGPGIQLLSVLPGRDPSRERGPTGSLCSRGQVPGPTGARCSRGETPRGNHVPGPTCYPCSRGEISPGSERVPLDRAELAGSGRDV